MRVRFAPSPTGNVHIGNMRVAVFNYLAAQAAGGEFFLRVEDTDLERSTPAAIENMLQALAWLEMPPAAKPLYQTSRRKAHDAAIKQLQEKGHATKSAADAPVSLRLRQNLFANAPFLTAAAEEATITWQGGKLTTDLEVITHTVTSAKSGQTYTTPLLWDTLTEPVFVTADGQEISSAPPDFSSATKAALANLAATEKYPLALALGAAADIVKVKFKRRFVFFDDIVLGRCQKPLDSLRDLVLARSDGSPVFHLANVVDDAYQKITHILRGNDHLENTFRHLFIFHALGLEPPRYGHFPMITNAKGKPYSKRDGAAYVGDFQAAGYLPAALFNFLALCGWSPGDNREFLPHGELVKAFSLERVNAAACQFDPEKLAWLNQQYMQKLSDAEFGQLLQAELAKQGHDITARGEKWLAVLGASQRERLRVLSDITANSAFLFNADFSYHAKAVKKNLQKNEGAGWQCLNELAEFLPTITNWQPDAIEAALGDFASGHDYQMGQVAQPLRIACTGAAVSPAIGQTLYLLGQEEVSARVARLLQQRAVLDGNYTHHT